VLTDHSAFDYAEIVRRADLIVDARNAIRTPAAHVFRIGAPAPAAASRTAAAEVCAEA